MGLFSKPDVHSVLLVDIASASVGIGLSGIRDGKLPELAFAARVPFAHKPGFDLAQIEPAMMIALRDALGIAFREGTKLLDKRGFPRAINHAIISFSSPWHTSELGADDRHFRARLEELYSVPVDVFESDFGLMSAAEKRLVKRIEDEILRTFGIKEGIGLQSFNFTFSRVLSHALSDDRPATFIDMTGHTTDILSMRNGSFSRGFTVPLGTHSLRRGGLIPWKEFWQKLDNGHLQDLRSGNVFLSTDDYVLATAHLEKVLPDVRIIPFGSEGGLLSDMIITDLPLPIVERLAVLATYSNLFL